MIYQTFVPQDQLNGLVKCYWTMESSADEHLEKQSIVPDGCMEMIFHYGEPYRQYMRNGTSVVQPRCFVIGQLTFPLEIEPTGITGIFSVRFQPNGFLPFNSTIPIKEMENRAVPLEELFGQDGQDLKNKICNAQSVQERIKLVEIFLVDRSNRSDVSDHIVRSAVETILTTNGRSIISELIVKTEISKRQLERKFHLELGLGPKQLSKIIRLQTTVKMLLTEEFTSLTTLALENGYYDQSHFIKDFKEFVGVTPKEFYMENLKMSTFFIRD
ncbi:AraC family transcriptional regulator [Chryseobacterium sp. CBo1]|uniref:AraC family transcriptional regulator n=1 Tax=Chryseobacterium sp. CBo1 TaxID=1869230 RepID=UPI0008104C52|nr:helix-turn-helix domain-containing protein [Chryseobacterium sp. CBo1]OCK52966.1 AraC family transcriptional regulator [Chryseobacterium sp. CBo1]